MTLRHMISGVMSATGIRTQSKLEDITSLPKDSVCYIQGGKHVHMRLDSFLRIHQATGVPASVMLDWYALPEGADMGRVERLPAWRVA